jgi:uncharacterized protein YggE
MKASEIIVKGRANVSQKPDCIKLLIRVKAQSIGYGVTIDMLNESVNKALEAMAAVCVDEEPQTDNYSIEENWADPYDHSKRRFIGYEGEQQLSVRMPLDMTMLGEVLKKLSSVKTNPSVHTYFEVRDPAIMQAEARRKSIEASKLAANEIAAQLGVTLKEVKSVKYDMPFGVPTSSLSINLDDTLQAFGAPEGKASLPNINPAVIESRDEITIIWAC